jgi:hypothetical protein
MAWLGLGALILLISTGPAVGMVCKQEQSFHREIQFLKV